MNVTGYVWGYTSVSQTFYLDVTDACLSNTITPKSFTSPLIECHSAIGSSITYIEGWNQTQSAICPNLTYTFTVTNQTGMGDVSSNFSVSSLSGYLQTASTGKYMAGTYTV